MKLLPLKIAVLVAAFVLGAFFGRYPTDVADPRLHEFSELFTAHATALHMLTEDTKTPGTKEDMVLHAQNLVNASDDLLALKKSKEVPQFYDIVQGIARNTKSMAESYAKYASTKDTAYWDDAVRHNYEADTYLALFVTECEKVLAEI